MKVAQWPANGFARTNRPISVSDSYREDACSVLVTQRRSISATARFPMVGRAGRCGCTRSGSGTIKYGSTPGQSSRRRSSSLLADELSDDIDKPAVRTSQFAENAEGVCAFDRKILPGPLAATRDS